MLLTIRNFSAPPFIRFFSELFLLINYFYIRKGLIICIGLYFVFTTAYSLNMLYPNKTKCENIKENSATIVREYLTIIILIILTGYNFIVIFIIT